MEAIKITMDGATQARDLIEQMAKVREQFNMTLKELAEKTPFTEAHWSSVLRSNNASLSTACILAHALGYTLTLKKMDDGK